MLDDDSTTRSTASRQAREPLTPKSHHRFGKSRIELPIRFTKEGKSMTIIFEERPSDSPYIQTITQGYTASDGTTIRPAECNWHMVFVRENGCLHPIVVGPLTTSGPVSWKEGAEILWIRFSLGTFMPHLPFKHSLNIETTLPKASSKTFWLNGSSWQFPDFENVETFIERLVRDEILLCDPMVSNVLENRPLDLSPRTVRHRFQQATGLSQKHIDQYRRAQKAMALLNRGVPILDTVLEAGYYDQPHLTRSLKRFIGTTPGEEYGRSCEPG
jgi:hypothetical protein